MERLKIFGLGFFSNKTAEKSIKGGFGLLVVNFILVLVVIFFGTALIEMASFYPRYDNAPQLKSTVSKLFAPSDSGDALTFYVDEDKYLSASRGDEGYKKAMLVNTFLSDEDRAAYSSGGFNVVVDTRPASLYAYFEAYCESTAGDGQTITYEEYLSLNEIARQNYRFRIRYTPDEVDLSDEKTAERKNYLVERGGTTVDDVNALENELSTGERDEKSYKEGRWVLFVKDYYPDMSEYEQTAEAPLVRNYYYHTYTAAGETNYLFIFDDSVIGAFTTTDGKTDSFYGFYQNFAAGKITDGDGFIETAFSASAGLNYYVALMNIMRFLPVYIVMPIVAALIAYLIEKIAARGSARGFSAVLKVVSSFILWSAIFAAAITFGLSLFVDRSLVFVVISVAYFVVITARSIIWFIADINKLKKQEGSNAA